MGKIIQFPISIENQEQVKSEEEIYKEYYGCSEQYRKIFETEQFIADQELAIQYFKNEESRLKDQCFKLKIMIEDMEKELEVKKQELQKLNKEII